MGKAKILLPSAVHLEERLTANQSVPEPSQQSVTQKHTVGFLSVADAAPSSGDTLRLRASSGRMVMQVTGDFLVGGSNPGRVNTAPPPPPTVG